MSTDYNCSRWQCEHARAFHAADETCLADFPGDDCETCDWHYTARGSNNWMPPTFEKCPACKVGHVMVYGKPHVSPMRLALTRALTAQAWAVACSIDAQDCVYGGAEEWFGSQLAALPSPAELAAEILGDTVAELDEPLT